uniref:Non-structural protein 1a n=1 Tax=Steinernema glaseri TaxID=37863 RepID=A0A1I7YS99_9BILA
MFLLSSCTQETYDEMLTVAFSVICIGLAAILLTAIICLLLMMFLLRRVIKSYRRLSMKGQIKKVPIPKVVITGTDDI